MPGDPKLLSCYEGARAEKIRIDIEDLNANGAVLDKLYAFTPSVMGPTGSGKSTVCYFDLPLFTSLILYISSLRRLPE